VIISSNAKGVAPLFSSFEYNAVSNARTMLSSGRRFVKWSLSDKTAEKLSIYQEVASAPNRAIASRRLKREHMIILRAWGDSFSSEGVFHSLAGQVN
jgi:hypothetical protein